MQLTIDFDSKIPLYTQIRDAIVSGIATGDLTNGTIWQECQWSGQKLYGSAECVWLSLKFTHYQIFYQRLILFNVP